MSEIVMIDSKALYVLVDLLTDHIDSKLKFSQQRIQSDSLSDWVTVKEAMRLLSVGRTKMQQLKNGGNIRFSQDQKKLRFSRSSIIKYLENIRHKRFITIN